MSYTENGSKSELTSGSESSVENRIDEDDHAETLKRAADLLHEALSLNNGGGVVFMETESCIYKRHGIRRKITTESSEDEHEESIITGRRDSAGENAQRLINPLEHPQQSIESTETRLTNQNAVNILAMSKGAKFQGLDNSSTTGFVALSQADLSKLIRRHPRGKLFNLDPEGLMGSSSSSEDYGTSNSYAMPRPKKITPSKAEAKLLFKHFPGARQVIFLPLWNASISQFSSFFVYNFSEFRTFSNNPDFLYCIAFGNCVMTEITRQATIAADQQKGDFIGSISHELRSPLHGILASCEFLAETETTSFQQSLVDTADSCARTLLDTINMVLDYSKINAFERNANKARRRRGHVESGMAEAAGHLQPSLNIYGDVDLAAITEEVVEGVATGQVFKDSLTGDDMRQLIFDGTTHKSGKDIDVILEIAPRQSIKDWLLITQPGAFRRIVMNIFGNALKYTSHGFIKVKLEADEPGKHDCTIGGPNDTVIKLQVTDTGQGMSSHFMRTKLFLPFSQENTLSSGTGLGLSLVRSLVSMLNGDITIQSTKDVGTHVTVVLPMSQSTPSNSTAGSTTSSGSIERTKDDSLIVVQQKARGRAVMLFPLTASNNIRQKLQDAVTLYLRDWFHFTLLEKSSPTLQPDIVITHEMHVPELIKAFPQSINGTHGPTFVVLCTPDSRRSNKRVFYKSSNVEVLCHPFGPYKLAKSLRRCLEKIEGHEVTEMSNERVKNEGAVEWKEPQVEGVTIVEQITLTDPGDPNIPDVHIIKQGPVLANEDSVHAQIVIDNAQVSDMKVGSDQTKEFPFPEQQQTTNIPSPLDDGTVSPTFVDSKNRPPLESRRTISPTSPEMKSQAAAAAPATPTSCVGAITAASSGEKLTSSRSPRLLVVDDNKVNLRLLQTYLKKRNYTDIFTAEDGAQAVALYTQMLNLKPPPTFSPPTTTTSPRTKLVSPLSTPSDPQPPDIIFMDISMPILDGFEATRQIRTLESQFRQSLPPYQTPPCSLIIALTGLASGRDQSEAFTSGFDLYLVKPISFREVGRLLDSWEKNGPSATVGGRVPYGPVTEADVGEVEAEREVNV
jgi:signal transduction histidine kinase/CheY-like chemotaxis protein